MMKRAPDRPVVTPEMIERFAAYYKENRAWGDLHVVLDDGNFKDGYVDHCIEWSNGEGKQLAIILRSLTQTQRRKVGRRAESLINFAS